MQQAPVALVAEAEGMHQAGDVGSLRAARGTDKGHGHPEEGAQPSAGGTEGAEGVKPGDPEVHDIERSTDAGSMTVPPVRRRAYRHPQRYALGNDHLQGKALAAANREGEGATGRARRPASG